MLTDDDALPDPGWLKAYAEADRTHPDFDIFTGPVHYVWRCPEPIWFPSPPQHEIVLVYKTDLGTEDVELGDNFCLGGHNICLRRSRVLELGGFDPQLGPGSPHGSSGEDCELMRRWRNAGSRALYVARARTGHRIYDDRTSRSTLVSNYHRAGYSESWEIRAYAPRNTILPMPLWWLNMILSTPMQESWQMLTDLLRGRSSAAFYHRLKLSHWRGKMRFLKDLTLHRIAPAPYRAPATVDNAPV